MLKFFRSLLSSNLHDHGRSTPVHSPEPPAFVSAPGVDAFAFAAALQYRNALPVPDWEAVSNWLHTMPETEQQSIAWGACEVAWLQHLCAALGSSYYLALPPQKLKIDNSFFT